MCLISRLEKEYTKVKHKEAEDNQEIRRQKTENRTSNTESRNT